MTLLFSALLGLQAAPESVDRWMAELGAEQSEVRDAAQKKLLEAGAAATKSLTLTAASTKDPEVKVRAEALLQQIADQAEIRLLLDLRTVTLAPGRHTMEAALQALSAAGGPAVTAPSEWNNQPFELAWDAVPFGQAVEELCRAYGGLIACRSEDGSLALCPGEPSRRSFAYAGSLRIEINDLMRSAEEKEERTFDASGMLRVSTLGDSAVPPWKIAVNVSEARLKDGTCLASSGFTNPPAVISKDRGFFFQFSEIPRSAFRLASVSGVAEVTAPVGSVEVTLGAEDVGIGHRVGEYLLTLTELAGGKASIAFMEILSGAAAENSNLWCLNAWVVSGADPARSAVEQRLNVTAIVGLDKSGREVWMERTWKKRPSLQEIRVVDRRVRNLPLPILELTAGELGQVRLRFKPRSATVKLPFTLKEVPLP